jgi:DNA-binding SARP family transcriptional activator
VPSGSAAGHCIGAKAARDKANALVHRLSIGLLGKPAFEFDSKPWKLTAPPRCLPLLGLLTRSGVATVSRASLAAALWPEELDTEGRTNLRRHLYRLTRGLPAIEGIEWIAGDNLVVGWNNAAPAQIDVRVFEELVAAGKHREAAAIYRGDFLDGYYEDFVLAERERLRSIATELLITLARESRAERDFAGAAGYAQRLLDIDEWREDALREWMTAKYESSERSAAIAAYERFARRLREEFAADPAAETTALRDAIRSGAQLPNEAAHVFERSLSESAHRGWKLPLVGRDDELERLRAAWSRAARGNGSVAFLSGEAGIGKSRLAAELASLVREQGGHALIGVTSNPEGEPYQAVLVALRGALSLVANARVEATWLAALAHVLPEIRSLREGLGSEELPPDRARERLFEAIVRVLEQLGRMRPLCVVLEDLHWAGPATLELVGALARRIGGLPILLVVTYRSEESNAGDPLRKLRTALVGERRAMAAPLERLQPDDIERVVNAVVGDAAAPASLGDGIVRLSEGNPLFVVQLIEGFLETGRVPDESSALGSVGDAISARAKRLHASVRSVAEVAATVGMSFRADLVADAGGWDENAVLDAVGELMDRALVRESGGELEYVFTHALVAATFYRESPEELRSARHRRIAALLERNRQSTPSADGSMAIHWRLAGEPERAARACLRAGEAAFKLYARAEAMAYAREALELTADPDERFKALLLLANAQHRNGDMVQWKRDLERLAESARDLGPGERFAALEQRAAYDNQTADRVHQHETIETMRALAQADGTPRMRAIALTALGRFDSQRGNLAESIDAAAEALALALSAGAGDVEIDARYLLAHGLARLGRYDEAGLQTVALREEAGDERTTLRQTRAFQIEMAIAGAKQDTAASHRAATAVLEIARSTGDLELEIASLMQLAWSSQPTLDAPLVRRRYAEVSELAERIGYEVGIESSCNDLGVFESRIGNHRGALVAFERALVYARRGTSVPNLGYAQANRARELVLLGQVAKSLEAAREAEQVAESIGERRLKAAASMALGTALFAGGERQEGLEKMRVAIELRREIGDAMGFGTDVCGYAEAAVEAGRSDDYPWLIAELKALCAGGLDTFQQPVRICYVLGVVLEASGDAKAARGYYLQGQHHLTTQFARIPDEETRAFVGGHAFNQALLARLARYDSGPETRKARRSS